MLRWSLLELIAPIRCAGCDLPGHTLCPQCMSRIVRTDSSTVCPRCGEVDGALRCPRCSQRPVSFSATRSVGPLETPLSRVITVYKDGGERRYAALLGDLLAHAVEEWQGWPEAVVAVPPTRTARRRRGFDHTLPLARAVAVTLDAPVVTLLAVGARRDQRDLGRVARLENMSGAFTVIGDGPVPRRIVLVDDVMTTGATLDAASEALLAAGAEEVRAAVLAHA